MLRELMATAKLDELYEAAERHSAERELVAEARREKAARKAAERSRGPVELLRAAAGRPVGTASDLMARIPWG